MLHIYAAGSCSDTDLPTGTSPGPPAKYVPSSYTSLKEALNQMLYLIAEYVLLKAMHEARKLNVNYN
jgi:hypothetical protein